MPVDSARWDDQADVVVVGFGGAGACAAIEAARSGADVVVLDRFSGGGATAMSGGVVYAGGGTSVQRAAGVSDTADAMFDYLAAEVGDVVDASTLRRFCDSSPAMIDWLAELGVPFDPSLCPYKTSYPGNDFYLYYSGSENAWPFRSLAAPAPRGHRAHGRGTSGRVLYAALSAAASSAARVREWTAAVGLVVSAGRVVGVECSTLSGAPARVRRRLARLHRLSLKPGLYAPALARRLHRRIASLEKRWGRPYFVAARRGVVLAAGGFVNNREMMREHAPAYRGGLPLGTQGDDGSGIRLGTSAGGVAERLSTVSAWRFLTPPSALMRGILVGPAGERFVDESSYGAAIGSRLIEGGGKAWLLVDEPIMRAALRSLRSETLWFQRLQGWYLLRWSRVRGASLSEVARRAGIAVEGLTATVAAYGAAEPDAFGKDPSLVAPLSTPPYSLIDCSYGPRLGYPCPMLTLGGLVVDESTGQVLSDSGSPVAGLYAAGRTAVGICSNSYVSGLSLADCVFSGRRAGTHAATQSLDSQLPS